MRQTRNKRKGPGDPQRKNKRWTHDEDERVIALRDMGFTLTSIAIAMKRPRTGVMERLKKHRGVACGYKSRRVPSIAHTPVDATAPPGLLNPAGHPEGSLE